MEQYNQAPPVQQPAPQQVQPMPQQVQPSQQQPLHPGGQNQGPIVQGNPPMDHLMQRTDLEQGGQQAIIHDMHGWEGDADEQAFLQALNDENPNAPQNTNGLQYPSPQTPQQAVPGQQMQPQAQPGYPQQPMQGQQMGYPGYPGQQTAQPHTQGTPTPVVYDPSGQTQMSPSQIPVDPMTGQPMPNAAMQQGTPSQGVTPQGTPAPQVDPATGQPYVTDPNGQYMQPMTAQPNPAQPNPAQPTMQPMQQPNVPQLSPQELTELQNFRDSKDFKDAKAVMDMFRQNPKEFYRTYMPEVFSEIQQEDQIMQGGNPEDFAREWADAELKKRYGDDFEFDASEAMVPGSDSHKYSQDSTLLLQRGLQVYDQKRQEITAHQQKRQQQAVEKGKSVLREFGIPEDRWSAIEQITQNLENSPENYFRMVFTYLDRLGHLNQLRGNPNMPAGMQSMIPQGTYPQGGYPQGGYPQRRALWQQQPTQMYVPQGQPQLQQQTLAQQTLAQQMQPMIPMPGVQQAGSGLPIQGSQAIQTFAEMFPTDMLNGNDEAF